jgi:hypothetical protein
MAEHLGPMAEDVGTMSMCMDKDGTAMGTGDMGMLVRTAKTECARHEGAMMQAVDMNAAMLEENAHQGAMTKIAADMTRMRGEMMSGMMGGKMMGDYTCSMKETP